ncbi:hypothetical protein GIY23_01360 [Allosaccharopolyspora coralli]|uniref:Uncharacterized protein n=1 Tax=Allosaccharopolyspora coralli TaxID=2665642 RepID=A0A5Q3QBM4_9PSEU|nr:hypothetical protein GIY23_01360 [Allosaccharopolyspora coralli]
MDVAEGAGPLVRLQNLLLTTTGRVDDDAVNSAREMLGADGLAPAAELLAGCLIAGRVPVTAREQSDLRRVLAEARSQSSWADRLYVVESVPADAHRFSDQNRPEADVSDALQPIVNRLPGLRGVWCVWRVTPAGVTYGAVPRRVVLAEIGAEGSVEAAGFQMLEALRRAGLGCSVDVFASGSDLPDYHRNALAAARRVYLDVPVSTGHGTGNHGRAARMRSGGEPAPAGISGLADPLGPPGGQRPHDGEPEPETFDAPSTDAEPPSSGALPVADAADTGIVLTEPVPAEPQPDELSAPAPESRPSAPAQSGRSGVPAAVDAKLTDRERNLLRKLHEELAQREKDRAPAHGDRHEAWTSTSTTATGGFPSIGAPAGHQQR